MSAFAVKLGSGNPKAVGRKRRHIRVRKKISGTGSRPRLVVTRSARHMVAQVVDDTVGKTLVWASTMESDLRASDSDKTAYLSFDYSNKPFIKFNEITLTFSNVSYRPSGSQFAMTIF